MNIGKNADFKVNLFFIAGSPLRPAVNVSEVLAVLADGDTDVEIIASSKNDVN